MPLSPAAPRQHIHTRIVDCRGYRRADGLWDIEGHITDVKTYDFGNHFRGAIAAGTPVHDMWVRLTLDVALPRPRRRSVVTSPEFVEQECELLTALGAMECTE